MKSIQFLTIAFTLALVATSVSAGAEIEREGQFIQQDKLNQPLWEDDSDLPINFRPGGARGGHGRRRSVKRTVIYDENPKLSIDNEYGNIEPVAADADSEQVKRVFLKREIVFENEKDLRIKGLAKRAILFDNEKDLKIEGLKKRAIVFENEKDLKIEGLNERAVVFEKEDDLKIGGFAKREISVDGSLELEFDEEVEAEAETESEGDEEILYIENEDEENNNDYLVEPFFVDTFEGFDAVDEADEELPSNYSELYVDGVDPYYEVESPEEEHEEEIQEDEQEEESPEDEESYDEEKIFGASW